MLSELAIAAMIVSVCLLLHVTGLLLMADWLMDRRDFFARKNAKVYYALLIVFLFSGIMFLHIVETSLWATYYYTRGHFSDFETSLYFSLTSYTTIGYGDVLLPQRWRLLGAIEGVTGVLLCGISTAFIFAVMTALVQMRLRLPKNTKTGL